MSRTAMTVDQIPGAYANTLLNLAAMHAFDQTNGMTAPASGDLVIIINNPTVGAVTVTVPSAADAYGRTEDALINAYSLAAGHVLVLPKFKAVGWSQGPEGLHLDASATGLLYLCLQDPAGQ